MRSHAPVRPSLVMFSSIVPGGSTLTRRGRGLRRRRRARSLGRSGWSLQTVATSRSSEYLFSSPRSKPSRRHRRSPRSRGQRASSEPTRGRHHQGGPAPVRAVTPREVTFGIRNWRQRMCRYSTVDGVSGDRHLAHPGARAGQVRSRGDRGHRRDPGRVNQFPGCGTTTRPARGVGSSISSTNAGPAPGSS